MANFLCYEIVTDELCAGCERPTWLVSQLRARCRGIYCVGCDVYAAIVHEPYPGYEHDKALRRFAGEAYFAKLHGISEEYSAASSYPAYRQEFLELLRSKRQAV